MGYRIKGKKCLEMAHYYQSLVSDNGWDQEAVIPCGCVSVCEITANLLCSYVTFCIYSICYVMISDCNLN